MSGLAVIPCGRSAALVEVSDAVAAASLAAWARSAGVEAEEIVPAARTVLFDGLDGLGGDVRSPSALARALAGWSASAPPDASGEVTVPVVYDGPDLARVAALWDCEIEEVVARHTAQAFTSAFCGFAPGFAYLAGLPDALAVPRLDTPRARVPAGSVALAGHWCGVYPTASPGGWLLLGRTDLVLWDTAADPPALLAPGTRVRFTAAAG